MSENIEKFKKFEELNKPDIRHLLCNQVFAYKVTLESLYADVSAESITSNAPEEIISNFNILKNLVVYSWFCYSFQQIAHHQSYIIIEHALRIKACAKDKSPGLKKLISSAIENEWINDSGFRHINEDMLNSADNTEYCKQLVVSLPKLRNCNAHGSNSLWPFPVMSLRICADLINQLFKE
ncbi:hypothetical protein EPN96_02065 [bacterium]|nr:MAG: hypothetical protein EPN96_02065 [bacterium]